METTLPVVVPVVVPVELVGDRASAAGFGKAAGLFPGLGLGQFQPEGQGRSQGRAASGWQSRSRAGTSKGHHLSLPRVILLIGSVVQLHCAFGAAQNYPLHCSRVLFGSTATTHPLNSLLYSSGSHARLVIESPG